MVSSISRTRPTAVPSPTPSAAPRLGASGPAVAALQRQLNARGERLAENGTFGPRTQEAVRRFQLAQRIQPANGIVGPATAAALSRPAAPAPGTTDTFEAARPRNAPVALRVPSAPPAAAAFKDLELGVFDRDPRWKPFHRGPGFGNPNATRLPFHDRVAQRYFVEGGNSMLTRTSSIYTETHVVSNASPEQLVGELTKQTFWSGGKVENWKEHADGTKTYVLKPAGKMVEVHEKMHPPVRLPDGAWVMRVDMSAEDGAAAGRAYFLVKPRPEGGADVYGRFANVDENSAAFSPEDFAKNHLLGERGRLNSEGGVMVKLIGLPDGTGIGPAVQRAEAATARAPK